MFVQRLENDRKLSSTPKIFIFISYNFKHFIIRIFNPNLFSSEFNADFNVFINFVKNLGKR